MTNEELNVEIAKYRGWRNIREQDYQPFGTDPYIDGPSQVWVGIHPESDVDSKEYEVILDYCNDLNEMHDAEKYILDFDRFGDELAKVVLGYTGTPEDITLNYWALQRVAHANGRQRAKAFVRTIDKWKE
jgi:hypothetical protein